ncbi:MAG: WD40-like beta Propeller containing protein [Gemmatimonadetes bacterium]|nr:WD40-like beta Propeller containing protein [Gemmatimonadota bacterium]
MTNRKFLLVYLVCLVAANVPAVVAQGAPPTLPAPRDAALPTVFHIGDSTVRNGSGNGANGQWGWGDMMSCYFDTTRVNVVNRALGGRSSRTYLTQGHWDRTLPMIKRGDLVIMQFGHNDASAVNDTSRARGTIHGVGEESEEIDNLLTHQREVVHTFGWYLRRFVSDTRSRGAMPIIASRVPGNNWANGAVLRNKQDFALWAEQVARMEGVAFIDLNELVAREYDALGEDRVKPFFVSDRVHTTLDGAKLSARVVASTLSRLPNPVHAYMRSGDAAAKACAQ